MNRPLSSTVLQLLIGTCLACSPAHACPSIDSWLEYVRLKQGSHAYVDAFELNRRLDRLGEASGSMGSKWTGGIAAILPNGEQLLLLVVNTGVCGVIRLQGSGENELNLRL